MKEKKLGSPCRLEQGTGMNLGLSPPEHEYDMSPTDKISVCLNSWQCAPPEHKPEYCLRFVKKPEFSLGHLNTNPIPFSEARRDNYLFPFRTHNLWRRIQSTAGKRRRDTNIEYLQERFFLLFASNDELRKLSSVHCNYEIVHPKRQTQYPST